jgi:5'-3' exonuclease
MGVPGFFLWLIKNYKNSNIIFQKELINDEKLLKNINNLDILLIDTNCLIHPQCFKVITNKNYTEEINEEIEKEMIDSILEYINFLIKYINPIKGVYIAIDGVAPLAKIKQQRLRRFKSIADKKVFDNIKKKHNKEVYNSWNTNAITPGTLFMEKLHNAILLFMNNYNIKIIYSSYLTPGEGEHKLLQFIKKNNNLSYIIYGLDADLIFLSLASKSNNIFLLREAVEFDKKANNLFNIVNINLLKNVIKDTIIYYIKKIDISYDIEKLSTENLINDFIFICYFLGNDFLPHILSLEIYENGIEILLMNYVKILLMNNLYIINGTNINQDFLKEFILKLSLEEEYNLIKNFNNKKFKKIYGDEYEKEVFKIENLLFSINDPIKIGSDNYNDWRKRYYKYYWNLDDDEIESFSEKLVYNYIIGLKWITLYYFDKCSSWTWYYPFEHPPFIGDISKYLNKIDLNKINFELGKPIKPFVQLLAVLPPQSNTLLPINLRKLITNPKSSLLYLYPSKFEQDFINKKKYWMAIPKLPPLNIKLIKYKYNKYKNEILDNEKNRNICEKIFTN